jgi:hypothetical protein
MGLFQRWIALFRAKKEEEKHIVTEEELTKEDSEFKLDESALNKILAEKNKAKTKKKSSIKQKKKK